MDCKVFKSIDNIDVIDFNKKLLNLDFYTVEKKAIALFHCNLIEDNIYHIVFNIDEEICTTSKYIKNISTMPINMYINTFLLLSKNILCIENIHSEYCNLIINKIFELTNINFTEYKFSQDDLINIIKNKTNQILQYEYENDGSISSFESKEEIELAIEGNESIYYINITPKLVDCSKVLVSIKKTGEINIKANIPLLLIKLLKYFLSEI